MQLSSNAVERVIDAIRQPWWKPADPVLMKMLSEKHGSANRRIARIGLWAAALINACFIIFDVLLLPDVSTGLVASRILAAIVFISLIEYSARTNRSLEFMHIIAATAIVYAAVGWLFFALPTQNQIILSHFIMFGTIFVLGANLFFNFRFHVSAITSLFITLVFVSAILLDLRVDSSIRILLSSFFVCCLMLSLYLSWRMSRERYMTFLHGLQAEFQEQVALEQGEKLKKIANTDTLTGLFNRRAISQEYLNICKKGLGENEQIGIVLIDIDYFAAFTESLGRNAADECLIRLSETLSQTATANRAIAGRYGAEEFIILCRVDSESDLRVIAQQLCEAVDHLQIAHPSRTDGRRNITISAGATMTQNDSSMDLTTLLQQADRALYASKFADRATFTLYDPNAVEEDASGQNLTELLKLAIARRRVSVVYQPIYDCRTLELVGHETLMRLRDFDGSPINPAVFIPLAEQTGAIVELGMWAIDQVCSDMAINDLGQVVSVNVSAIQLKTPEFAVRVAETLARHGVKPSKLALEITEGIDIVIETQAQKNIEALHNFGIQVWLDDFGTGFAGLAWLRQFDFDVVKIDRAFLHDCQTTQGLNLLQDMVRLLRNLGLKVLVEGVETLEQQQLLQRLAVNSMQGYFLGRPQPIENLV
jgi:diguanylate cyclase